MRCRNVSSRYSPEELESIAQRAKRWANSPEGKIIMEEAKKEFNGYMAMRKKERGEKPPINIYESFMRAI
ncbi:hypothetical protein J7J13_02730 [bacterium]|nr:hypothetical protein [bacterium]